MAEAKRKAGPRVVRLAARVQDAVDGGADTAEEIHKRVASLPLDLLEQIERFKDAAKDLHELQDRSIGVVYDVVRGINHDVIRLAKEVLAPRAKARARARRRANDPDAGSLQAALERERELAVPVAHEEVVPE